MQRSYFAYFSLSCQPMHRFNCHSCSQFAVSKQDATLLSTLCLNMAACIVSLFIKQIF
jgi:hypothetical protein